MYANAFNTDLSRGQTLRTAHIPIIYTVSNGGNNYTIDLTSPIRDVVSIELIRALVPLGVGDVAANPAFVTLHLNGYTRITSNNNNSTGGFCNIYCENPVVNDWYTYNKTMHHDSSNIYYFPEPTRLQRLNISFSDPEEGTVLTYANHVLTFEIKTLGRT